MPIVTKMYSKKEDRIMMNLINDALNLFSNNTALYYLLWISGAASGIAFWEIGKACIADWKLLRSKKRSEN